MDAVLIAAERKDLLRDGGRASVDSTGLETRHVSTHFAHRRDGASGTKNKRRTTRRARAPFRAASAYPMLTVVCDERSHLYLAAQTFLGPRNEAPFFEPVVRRAAARTIIDTVLADAAFDTDSCHTLCREELGIRSTVIPLNPRGNGPAWPKGKYRRQMRRKFHRHVYGQRWQVESSFSGSKRRFGSSLSSTTPAGRACECLLWALVHNLAIVRRPRGRGSQQSSVPPVSTRPLSSLLAFLLVLDGWCW